MAKTKIEWTRGADGSEGYTWNPVRGCTKISPGCKHCYAETFAERFRGVPGHPYEQGFDLRLVPEKLDEPLRWRHPAMVFVNSMSDLFHEDVPDDYLDQVFAVMALSAGHTFQVLTKRSRRLAAYLSALALERIHAIVARWAATPHPRRAPYLPWQASLRTANGFGKRWGITWPLPNVWIGVSCEDRKHGLPRLDFLRGVPAAVRFVSFEPLLEDLGVVDLRGIDWGIIGGESGGGARPMLAEWARGLIEQCRAAGVATFVKQLGARFEDRDAELYGAAFPKWQNSHPRKRLAHQKGGDIEEWPPDLRVRQFPEVHRG